MKLVNVELLKNPVNYLIVGLMVLIAGVLVHLLWPQFGMSTSEESK